MYWKSLNCRQFECIYGKHAAGFGDGCCLGKCPHFGIRCAVDEVLDFCCFGRLITDVRESGLGAMHRCLDFNHRYPASLVFQIVWTERGDNLCTDPPMWNCCAKHEFWNGRSIQQSELQDWSYSDALKSIILSCDMQGWSSSGWLQFSALTFHQLLRPILRHFDSVMTLACEIQLSRVVKNVNCSSAFVYNKICI